MKKMQQREDDGAGLSCRCSTWNRYVLPSYHCIQVGIPISIRDIHPRWWVHPDLSPLEVTFEHIDTAILSELKDPAATLPRKGRPKGTRRLQTSAEVVQRTTDRIEKVRRCGSCKITGHNRRTCPRLSSNLTTPKMRRCLKNKRSIQQGNYVRMTRQTYKMMNHLPGTTTIIAMKKSRKCGPRYSLSLGTESENVEFWWSWVASI
ncbi:hypothetical protein V1525DRAFT_111213 [Lipomyces kononenkoae]|uniref:Uncharacterized protein n=1 Tax=Lipomyces kononenkoae TaxID=34357 RepID=A0ACC3T445_LIPKO